MTTPLFIAILDFSTDTANRASAIAHLEAQQPEVRSMPGCCDFRVLPSISDPSAVTVLHEWADQASFDRYLDSELFARSGEVLRPLMTEAPTSRRFHVELIEQVA